VSRRLLIFVAIAVALVAIAVMLDGGGVDLVAKASEFDRPAV
jgi:hypothetical protein